MNRWPIFSLLLVPLLMTTMAWGQATTPEKVQDAKLGNTFNVHSTGTLFLSGQPTPEDIATLKARGIRHVITLREEGELNWDEGEIMKRAGIRFTEIPFGPPESLTPMVFREVRDILGDAGDTPTLLHCGSANRVGAVWLAHRVLDQGVSYDVALAEAKEVGLRSAGYERLARLYIVDHQDAKSVRPGINDRFLQEDLKIDEWTGRFETESREVFAARNAIVAAIGIKEGDRIADIGAGTGLFTRFFSKQVGSNGWVFAVDIVPTFAEHIRKRASDDHLQNISAVVCPEDSISLPPASIDAAFICDTYHHFEYPLKTLTSIHQALRDDGQMILIDFDRIPGKSREFILEHVRADKPTFRREIEAAGFELIEEVEFEDLKENYFLRFRKR